jgi:GNAT superfamily N-acetyltransferase
MVTAEQAVVRPAQEADLPRILQLFVQLSAGSTHPQATRWQAGERHKTVFSELLTNPHYHLLVLEADGVVQGTATVYVLPDLDRGGSAWAVVEHVVVEEALRGRGLGAKLMGEAIRVARDAGCYKISLSSGNQRLDTHRFYEGIGFRQGSKGFSIYFE